MAVSEHRGVRFELPDGWRHDGTVAPGRTMFSIPLAAAIFVASVAIPVAAVGGVVLKVLVADMGWLKALGIGGCVGVLGGLILMVSFVVRTRKNAPAILKGPQGEMALLYVWRHNKDYRIPPMKARLQPDVHPYSPLGGTILRRGEFKIDDETHAWAVREAPIEAINDPDFPAGENVPFSADFDVFPNGKPIIECRLYGVMTNAECSRQGDYQQIAASIRRAG